MWKVIEFKPSFSNEVWEGTRRQVFSSVDKGACDRYLEEIDYGRNTQFEYYIETDHVIHNKLSREEKTNLLIEVFCRSKTPTLRIGQAFDHVLGWMYPLTYNEVLDLSILDDGNPASKLYYEGTILSVVEYIENHL